MEPTDYISGTLCLEGGWDVGVKLEPSQFLHDSDGRPLIALNGPVEELRRAIFETPGGAFLRNPHNKAFVQVADGTTDDHWSTASILNGVEAWHKKRSAS